MSKLSLWRYPRPANTDAELMVDRMIRHERWFPQELYLKNRVQLLDSEPKEGVNKPQDRLNPDYGIAPSEPPSIGFDPTAIILVE